MHTYIHVHVHLPDEPPHTMAVGFWKYWERKTHWLNWCIHIIFGITLGLKVQFWLSSLDYVNGDGSNDHISASVRNSMRVCMHVCRCMKNACMYACMYVDSCMHACMQIHVCMHVCRFMKKIVCVYVYVRVHAVILRMYERVNHLLTLLTCVQYDLEALGWMYSQIWNWTAFNNIFVWLKALTYVRYAGDRISRISSTVSFINIYINIYIYIYIK
jgi:hypothetical protein